MRPTKNGEIMDASAVVPNTAPACVPEKCSVAVRYVPIVTYQQPQTAKLRNIMVQSRILTEPGMVSKVVASAQTVPLVSTSLWGNARKANVYPLLRPRASSDHAMSDSKPGWHSFRVACVGSYPEITLVVPKSFVTNPGNSEQTKPRS